MAEHPEACAEWRDDLAAWLTAQGSPEREAALEDHLRGCAACRAEADGLLAVVAVSLAADPVRDDGAGAADPVAPPERLGPRVAARISSERRGQSFRRLVAVAAGGAAAAAVLVAAILVLPDDDPAPLQGDRFAFVVGDADAVVAPDDGGGSLVQLVATGLDPDVTYSLWLTRPDGTYVDRVPAGTFRPEDDGTIDVRLRSELGADEVGRVWATQGHDVVLDTKPG
jgi:anti-sigma factor RsiW